MPVTGSSTTWASRPKTSRTKAASTTSSGAPARVDAPVAQGDELVRVAAGLVEVVEHHHDGAAALGDEAVEQLEHVDLVREVEEGGRLVEQQQLGLLGERHRDPRALALAAGELVERAASRSSRVPVAASAASTAGSSPGDHWRNRPWCG